MRTTVNIDDHLLEEAKVLAARQRRSLGEVIDDSLRASLGAAARRKAAVVLPVSGNVDAKPRVDVNDKEALAEASGDNEWPRADS
jgi:hypothetical protein